MSLRNKLLLLACVVALLPAMLAAWLDSRLLASLSRELTVRNAAALAMHARATMRRVAAEHARSLARESRRVSLLLSLQAAQVERLLAAPDAATGASALPLFFAEDFDRGDPRLALGPAPTATDTAAAPTISEGHAVFHVAAGVPRAAIMPTARALAPMSAFYRSLRDPNDAVLKWQYTALENGLSNAYPGHGGYPAGFDSRTRPWYVAQREQPGLRWYRPHIDATTGALVINATMPLFDPAGRFAGITGIDLDLMAALDTVRLPRNLRQGSEVLLAAVVEGDAGASRDVVVLASQRDSRARGAWQTVPELAPLVIGDASTSAALRAALARGESGEQRVTIDGHEHFVIYQGFGLAGGYLVMTIPVARATAAAFAAARHAEGATAAHLRLLLLCLIAATAIAALVALVAAHRVTRPLRELIAAVGRLAAGDFSARVTVVSRDELGQLGAAFNAMVPQLAEHARVTDALLLAREVQQQLLPAAAPQVAGYDLSGITLYSEQTGGDYYDFVALDGPEAGWMTVVVADVSGHGIAPSLLMATARALLHGARDRELDLGGLLRHVNGQLIDDVHRGHFVTMFLLAIDARSPHIAWASAGHDPALRYRAATGDILELAGRDIPLGVAGDWHYGVAGEGALEAGDVIVIGTDGLWDAANPAGERYGKHRLREFIEAHAGAGAELIRDQLCASVRNFRGAAAQADDITIVVVKRLAQGAERG